MSVGEWNINSTGVKGLYHLEDTSDSSSTGATLTNTGSVVFNPAKFRNGADLGSSNTTKILTATNNLGIDGGSISICLWASMLAQPSSATWVLAGQGSANNKVIYEVQYVDSAGTKSITFVRERAGIAGDSTSFNTTLSTGQMNLLTLTYDGTTVMGYLNGSFKSSTTSTGNGNDATTINSICIGGRKERTASASLFASAMIDEVAYFNRALTPVEIKNYYAWALGRRTGTV